MMPANQDRALHLLFRTITRGSGDPADDLITRLKEIEDAHTDLLTDDEYAVWRSSVLNQVVERTRVPLAWRVTLAVCCLASVALIVYGAFLRERGAMAGGAAGLVVGAYLWYGLERDYAVKRSLGRESVESMHPEAAHERIRAGVTDALRDIASLTPPAPVGDLEVDVLTTDMAELAARVRGVERVADRRVSIATTDPLAAYRSFTAAIAITRALSTA